MTRVRPSRARATFRVARIVPLDTGDRDMAPTFPGISDSPTLESWDPPFPVDLRRVRPQDERFWEQYRTTPKAFVSLAAGQRLWRSRYGELTSFRVRGSEGVPADRVRDEFLPKLRSAIDPLALGLTVSDVRAKVSAASRGATDFGEYFVVLQFLPGGVGTGARRTVLQAGRRAAGARGWSAARRRLRSGAGAAAVPRRRARPRRRRRRARRARRAGVCRGHHVRAADVVGRCRRHRVADAARHALVIWLRARSAGSSRRSRCIWWTLRSLGRISERSLLAGEIARADDRAAGVSTRRYGIVGGDRGARASSASRCSAPAAPDGSPARARSSARAAALLVASLCLFSWRLRRQVRARSAAAAGNQCLVWASATRAIVPGAACCRWP